jgi:hypothetical protein
VTGGIDVRILGVSLRSRDPFRALAAGVILFLVQALVFRRETTRDVERAAAWTSARATWIGAGAALLLLLHAVHHGSFVAGGADAYGYVSQAYGWATGHLPRSYELPLNLPFPSGDVIQTPLGYKLGPEPRTMVPTYSPGLPLLMAVGIRAAGAVGPYLVVPISAVLYVWSTFLLGRRAGGPLAGAVAAIFVATSPVVLFQSVFPMSDVPAGAVWTGALVAALGRSRRAAAISGVCVALGLLIRPNLPFLAVVPLVIILARSAGAERLLRGALFCFPSVPVVVAVALINAKWFGSPLASGYGATADLYSLASVWPNLQRYPVWLWRSQSPLMLLALASLAFAARRDDRGAAVRAAWAMFVATLACYVIYFAFQEWWYLRFLLPGLGALFALAATGVIVAARRLPRPWSHITGIFVVLLMLTHTTGFARREGIFGPLAAGDRRYADVGEFVSTSLPENAVVFTQQHSGTIRHYGGRLTLRYDLLDSAWASRAAGEVERLGLHPYLVIDDWEIPHVQKHFGRPADQRLPWPYVARMRDNGGVTIYDMATGASPGAPVALERGLAPRYSGPKPIVLKPR